MCGTYFILLSYSRKSVHNFLTSVVLADEVDDLNVGKRIRPSGVFALPTNKGTVKEGNNIRSLVYSKSRWLLYCVHAQLVIPFKECAGETAIVITRQCCHSGFHGPSRVSITNGSSETTTSPSSSSQPAHRFQNLTL